MRSWFDLTFIPGAVLLWLAATGAVGWWASAVIDAAYVATSPHSPNSRHCNDKPVDGLLEAYPYGCYGDKRYAAMRDGWPPCIPDVNRAPKRDAE